MFETAVVKEPSVFEPLKVYCTYLFQLGRGWSGGARVLGKLPMPVHLTIRITVGQGHTALAVSAGGVVWTFLLSSILSLLFLPLFGRRPDID